MFFFVSSTPESMRRLPGFHVASGLIKGEVEREGSKAVTAS